MNPLIAKLLPYAGWPLAALIFWMWLGGREDLAAEVERCNSDKLLAIAQAEQVARQALQDAQDAHQRELARLAVEAQGAVNESREGREAALRKAAAAQRIIDELTRTIENEHNAPIAQVCLRADVPVTILDGLR